MRRAARVDSTQPAIVQALRAIGCSVVDTSGLGGGYPDLTVGLAGRTVMLEVKDGTLSPSRRQLTPAEAEFHRTWRGGPLVVVLSVEEAIAACTNPPLASR